MSEEQKLDQKTTLYCSYCGKSQYEVRKLIAGPAAFICCDECVDICSDTVGGAQRIAQVNSDFDPKTIKVGDVVQLRSGGPLMTAMVPGVDEDGAAIPVIECAWFGSGDELKRQTIKASLLRRA